MQTEDGRIIYECLNGEPDVFGLLVDKYKAGIYAFVYGKLRDFRDAQDVTQEVFIQAFRDLRTLKRRESFVFWLYRIAYTHCKMWIRARLRRPDMDFIEDQDPKTLEDSYVESYRESRVNESLHEAMDSLPETYREVLTLHYFGGMSSSEIARALGTSPAAIRMRLSRARERLKEDMLAMMSTTFERQRLHTSFTFHIVEAIKHIRFQPMPRTTGLPWGISLATGIIVAILGIGSYLNLSSPVAIPKDLPIPREVELLKVSDIPVDMLEASRTAIGSSQQWAVNNEKPSEPREAPALAPQGAGIELTARGVHEGDKFCIVHINGDCAIVGAFNTDNAKGAAYIFKYDGTAWREQKTLIAKDGIKEDYFGWSTAITDNYAFVGAPLDDDMGEDTGSVYIFRFDGVSWTEKAKLRPHGAMIKWCNFGNSVSVSGDYLIVGSPHESGGGGAIYIFKCDDGEWVEQAKLVSGDWAQKDSFGLGVSISGDCAIAGAWRHNNLKGSAYIFKRNGDVWKERAALVADDGEAGDCFGYCVSISGDYAIVGANGDKDKGEWSGSAYVFHNEGASWKQQAKLVSSDLARGDSFGATVCISGNYALVGASSKQAGVVYSFLRHDTSWEERARLTLDDAIPSGFGTRISISGDNAIIGASKRNNQTGAAYIYSCKMDLALPVETSLKVPSTFGGVKNSIKSNVITLPIEAESSIPKEFRLFQNYPNPFNPETWIPFSLSNSGHVVIRIYSSTGQLVKTLDLGQEPSGTYLSKEKAAYWDGRNEAGEAVASDVYFYTMQAGESRGLKKMVMAR